MSDTVVVEIGGVTRTAWCLVSSIEIRDYLNGQPNQCTLQVFGFVPNNGAEIKVGLGSVATADLRFAGHILGVTKAFPTGRGSEAFYNLQCISYEWLLNRRVVTRRWLSTSASTIAADLLADYTSGFTNTGIEAALPTLDEFSVTGETVSQALDRLAERIGASWLVTYGKVLFFGFDVSNGDTIPDITDTSAVLLLSGLRSETDFSPVRTRVLFEGGGSNLPGDVGAGETLLPVEDGSWYSALGGEVICEAQRITYTGVVTPGVGALVGSFASPTTAPAAARAVGSGITDGAHYYAVTFQDGSGETTPGPNSATITSGLMSSPGSNPTPTKVLGGALDKAANYVYSYSYVDTAGGETVPTTLPTVNTSLYSTPPADPTISSVQTGAGLPLSVNTHYWAVTFTNGSDESTPSTGLVGITVNVFDPTAQATIGIPVGPTGVTGRKLYRSAPGGGDYRLVATIANNTSTSQVDTAVEATRAAGAAVPGSSTLYYSSVSVEVTAGPSGTGKRRIYRTDGGASQQKFLKELADNTTLTWLDTVSDASLGANAPTSNTTNLRQASLTAIPVGPSGTTNRKLYRTAAGGSQLKLLATIAGNATTTYTDTSADAALGANVPTTNTSGLTTAGGTVNAGSTTVIVTGSGGFSSSGGWAQAAAQVFRYTGKTDTTLTGVPASGIGALLSTLNYGTEIAPVAVLSGVPASGAGSVVRTLPRSSPVNLLVVANDTVAQATMAAAVGGDGIHELTLRDGRFSLNEATERAVAKVAEVKDPLVTVEYRTVDSATRSGLEVTISRTAEGISGTFLVQQVTFSDFSADGSYPPTKAVIASSRRFSFDRLLQILGNLVA